MRFGRETIHALFLVSLPIVVAAFGLGVWSALGLVLLGLGWRWALTLTRLMAAAPQRPPVVLETISVSHFVEKVRWSMDRLGLPYEEMPNAGTLGAFFLGRTVPRLHVRTGAVTSTIGDSPAILRFLWGQYASEYGERAAFLEPTSEALALEAQLDGYGVLLQQWIYHHILPDRSLTLHIWGVNDPRLPRWQRTAITAAYPLIRILMRRAFRLRPGLHEITVQRIEQFLGEIEQRLSDGRRTVCGGQEISFVDITLAALSSAWLQPAEFGAGKAEAVRPAEESFPPDMEADRQRWRLEFPRVTELVERLYREERMPPAS